MKNLITLLAFSILSLSVFAQQTIKNEFWDSQFSLDGIDDIISSVAASQINERVILYYQITGSDTAYFERRGADNPQKKYNYNLGYVRGGKNELVSSGIYTVSGSNASWLDEDEFNCSSLGSYSFSMTGNSITFNLISDDCTDRKSIVISGKFVQQSDGLVSTDKIFIYGDFTSILNKKKNHIARWNGTKWLSLSGGIENCNKIILSGSDLYALNASNAKTNNGSLLNGVVKWDGNDWSSIFAKETPYSQVIVQNASDMLISGNLIFVKAQFKSSLNNADLYGTSGSKEGFASWDGTNWTAYSGTINYIEKIVDAGNGKFYILHSWIDGSNKKKYAVAEWNGTSFTSKNLSITVNSSTTDVPYIKDIAFFNNQIYISGRFDNINSVTAKNIAALNYTANTYSAIDIGLEQPASLYANSSSVFACGDFSWLPGKFELKYTYGSNWHDGGFVNGTIYSAASIGYDILIVAGDFDYVMSYTSLQTNNIAKFTGGTLTALIPNNNSSNSVNKKTTALTINVEDVYVGGYFTHIGNSSSQKIARYKDNSFIPLGEGLKGGTMVNDIAIKANDVFVSGDFTDAGGIYVNGLARWDGDRWYHIGRFGDDGWISNTNVKQVNTLAVIDSNLYVGGNFVSKSTNNNVFGVAKWDTKTWKDLGGLNGIVKCLRSSGENLFALYESGISSETPKLAKWNGKQWTDITIPYQSSIGNVVNSLFVSGSDIYISGKFILSQTGKNIINLAKWDGISWSAVGSYGGANSPIGEIKTVFAKDNDVYIGGNISGKNQLGETISNIARWDGNTWITLGSGTDNTVNSVVAIGYKVFATGNFNVAGNKPSNFFATYNPAIISSNKTTELCQGDSVQLNVPPDFSSYQWKKNGINIAEKNTDVLVVKETGTYAVEITFSSGTKIISDPKQVNIYNDPSKPIITSKNNQIFFSKNSDVILTASPGFSTYRWDKLGTVTESATNILTTRISNYLPIVVEVKDIHGCKAKSDVFKFYQFDTISNSKALHFCEGDSVQLSVPSDYTSYQWKYSGNNITSATKSSIAAKQKGNYSVVLNYADGTFKETEFKTITTIASPPIVDLSINKPEAVICTGENIEISAPLGYIYQWKGNGVETEIGANIITPYTGKYSVVLSNEIGCKTESNIMEITIGEEPPIAQINYIGKKSYFLFPLQTGNYNYQWYKNNQNLDGQTKALLETQDPGSYYLTLQNKSSGCYSKSNEIDLSSVKSVQKGYNIYPNPNNGSFSINFENSELPFRIIVRDIAGKTIKQIEVNGIQDLTNISIENAKVGTYILEIFTQNGKVTKQLMVK